MATHRVRRAAVDEVVPAAKLLTRAFADDPISRWCLACDDPIALIELEFLQAAQQLAAYGSLWATADMSGVAGWVPPGAGYDEDAVNAVINPALVARGGHPGRRIRFWEWIEDHRPSVRHWYLDMLAVEPDRQRSGLGSLLLADGLERADTLGEPSFLVTANPRTVPFYGRHGFVTESEEEAPEEGPVVWFMSRATSRNTSVEPDSS